jgi:acetylglutamate kinase
MKTLKVVKIGGNIIDNPTALHNILSDFSKLKHPKILVHGGGTKTTELSKKLGITTNVIEGRRVTSQETLPIATMVYGGLINKNIVTMLQAKSCNSIGLSGADGNSIKAIKRPVKNIDYGLVGDIKEVNTSFINVLLEQNITPVFCALTHTKEGQILNTNADTIASEIAVAMSLYYSVELLYCFEKPGVLKDINDEKSTIATLTQETFKVLLEQKIIANGMIPKIENCFSSLKKGVQKVCIGNASLIKTKSKDTYTTLLLQ